MTPERATLGELVAGTRPVTGALLLAVALQARGVDVTRVRVLGVGRRAS